MQSYKDKEKKLNAYNITNENMGLCLYIKIISSVVIISHENNCHLFFFIRHPLPG